MIVSQVKGVEEITKVVLLCGTKAEVTNKFYRVIDFKRDKDGIAAKVERIEYDPNRRAYIALILYKDGERRYIIAPRGLAIGEFVLSGVDVR